MSNYADFRDWRAYGKVARQSTSFSDLHCFVRPIETSVSVTLDDHVSFTDLPWASNETRIQVSGQGAAELILRTVYNFCESYGKSLSYRLAERVKDSRRTIVLELAGTDRKGVSTRRFAAQLQQ